MANNGFYNYNRKEALKNWQPMPNLHLPTELFNSFNNKMEEDHVDIESPENAAEGYDENVGQDYLKHIMLSHMDHLLWYILEYKGVTLGDVRQNIRFILNEIINDEVDEKYYLNTKEIYIDILGGGYINEITIYDLMDQAIKRENWRMIFYLIFDRDEELNDWFNETIYYCSKTKEDC